MKCALNAQKDEDILPHLVGERANIQVIGKGAACKNCAPNK